DDDHQDRAADAAAGEVADDRTDADTAAGRGRRGGRRAGAAEQGRQNLAPNATTDDSGNGVSDRAKVVVLEHAPCDVAADRAGYELDDQCDDVHEYLPSVRSPTEITLATG